MDSTTKRKVQTLHIQAQVGFERKERVHNKMVAMLKPELERKLGQKTADRIVWYMDDLFACFAHERERRLQFQKIVDEHEELPYPPPLEMVHPPMPVHKR